MKKPVIIILLVLFVDQLSKVLVKTNMYIGESIHVLGEKFQIYFIENNGMAFGMTLGDGQMYKVLLTVIRIVAAIALFYWLAKRLKKSTHTPNGLIISSSLIIAGAIGNIIDSMFYGLIFSASPENAPVVAQAFPPEGGYAGFLHGQVVDMLYFPLFTIENMPEFLGGGRFTFFNAIFNVADAAITTGVLMMFFFSNRYFGKPKTEVVLVVEEEKNNVPGENESQVN